MVVLLVVGIWVLAAALMALVLWPRMAARLDAESVPLRVAQLRARRAPAWRRAARAAAGGSTVPADFRHEVEAEHSVR